MPLMLTKLRGILDRHYNQVIMQNNDQVCCKTCNLKKGNTKHCRLRLSSNKLHYGQLRTYFWDNGAGIAYEIWIDLHFKQDRKPPPILGLSSAKQSNQTWKSLVKATQNSYCWIQMVIRNRIFYLSWKFQQNPLIRFSVKFVANRHHHPEKLKINPEARWWTGTTQQFYLHHIRHITSVHAVGKKENYSPYQVTIKICCLITEQTDGMAWSVWKAFFTLYNRCSHSQCDLV